MLLISYQCSEMRGILTSRSQIHVISDRKLRAGAVCVDQQ